MILKLTKLKPRDNSYVSQVRCFHHYFGFWKKKSSAGEFIKVSVRKRFTDISYIKSKAVRVLKKRKKLKSYIISTRFPVKKTDGTSIRFNTNSCVLLKKRLTTRGKYVRGPFIYGLRRKKILGSFIGLVCY